MNHATTSTFVVDELLSEKEAVVALVSHHGFEAATMSRESLMVCLMDGFLPDGIVLEADNQAQLTIEICAMLSGQDMTAHIPVLMVATNPSAELEQLAFEAGAADFMTRPISPATLLTRLENRIRVWREHRSPPLSDALKQAAAKLSIQAQDLGLTLMNTLPDICFVKDKVGRFVYCNPAFERLYGLSESQVQGKTDYEFVPKPQARHFEWEDQKVLSSGEAVSSVAWQTDGNGKKLLYETLKTPVRNAQGEVVGLMGLGRDITRWKQTEDALNRVHVEDGLQPMHLPPESTHLLAAAITGLESRMEPLVASGIMVTSTLAQGLEQLADQFSQGKVNKTAFGEYLYKTRQGCVLLDTELQRCSRLIETLNRLRWANELQDMTDVDLSQVVQSAIRHNRFKATTQGIELADHIAPDVCVRGNAPTWQFIAVQLVENALAHAFPDKRRGNMTMTLQRKGEWAEFSVEDDGVGVLDTDVQDIFKPYVTTGDATLHAGMGLTLIRHIVENHLHGQTDATRVTGGGLLLRIRVPVCAPGAQPGM